MNNFWKAISILGVCAMNVGIAKYSGRLVFFSIIGSTIAIAVIAADGQ
jgi:hypothetical protein